MKTYEQLSPEQRKEYDKIINEFKSQLVDAESYYHCNTANRQHQRNESILESMYNVEMSFFENVE